MLIMFNSVIKFTLNRQFCKTSDNFLFSLNERRLSHSNRSISVIYVYYVKENREKKQKTVLHAKPHKCCGCNYINNRDN